MKERTVYTVGKVHLVFFDGASRRFFFIWSDDPQTKAFSVIARTASAFEDLGIQGMPQPNAKAVFQSKRVEPLEHVTAQELQTANTAAFTNQVQGEANGTVNTTAA